MSRKIFLVGIGHRARVGKDTLAKCLYSLFDLDGYDTKIYSLAAALKNDLSDFLMTKCGVDVWTGDTQEKTKIRDLLVAYGKIQRERSSGTYWTNIVESMFKKDAEQIVKNDPDKPFVAIVPDIRYASFKNTDEVFWVKDKWKGKLINLNRKDEKNEYIQPANLDEASNDKLILEASDYQLTWESLGGFPDIGFYNSPIYEKVKPLYEKLRVDSLEVCTNK